MPTRIKFASLICTLLTMLVAGSTIVRAQAIWTGAADPLPPNGVFSNGGNWSGTFGLVPGAADLGIWSANATYTVTFTGNQALSHASVRGGTVSWLSDSATVRSFTLGKLSAGGVNQTLTIGSATRPLTVTSSTTIEAGSINTTGNGRIVVDGASSVLNSPSVQLGGFADLDGTLRYQNGAQGAIGGAIDLGNTANNDSNGLLEILSDADLTGGNINLATTTSTATGTINLSGAGSTLVQSGAATLTVGGASGGAGAINVSSDGAFTTGSGAITVNATGTMNVSGGAVNLLNNLANAGGALSLTSSGVLNGNGANGADSAGGGFAGAPGRSIATTGALVVSGADSQVNLLGGNGGRTVGSSSSASSGNGGTGGTLSIAGGMTTLSNSSAVNLRGGNGGNGGALPDGGHGGAGGMLSVTEGTTTLSDSFVVDLRGGNGGDSIQPGGNGGTGGSVLLSGGAFTMTGGKTLLAGGAGGLSVFGSPGVPGTAGHVDVSGGTFNFTAGQITADTVITPAAPTAVVKSTLNISGGTTNVNAALDLMQATVNLSAGVMNATTINRNFSAFNFTGGTLHVQTFNGSLTQAEGTLAPGASPGLTTINGDYTQNGGSLAIEIGGTDPGVTYDRVAVSGAANLMGTLDVTLTGGFTPSLGDSFGFLVAGGGFSPAFADINLPDISSLGLDWQLASGGSTLLLEVIAAGIPGDYNDDGTVNAADYTVWRDGGSPDDTIAGYEFWKANFGNSGGGAGESASAVPEPASALALLIGWLAMCIRRRSAAS